LDTRVGFGGENHPHSYDQGTAGAMVNKKRIPETGKGGRKGRDFRREKKGRYRFPTEEFTTIVEKGDKR